MSNYSEPGPPSSFLLWSFWIKVSNEFVTNLLFVDRTTRKSPNSLLVYVRDYQKSKCVSFSSTKVVEPLPNMKRLKFWNSVASLEDSEKAYWTPYWTWNTPDLVPTTVGSLKESDTPLNWTGRKLVDDSSVSFKLLNASHGDGSFRIYFLLWLLSRTVYDPQVTITNYLLSYDI